MTWLAESVLGMRSLTFPSLFRSARYLRTAAFEAYQGRSSRVELRTAGQHLMPSRKRYTPYTAHSLGANRLTPARTLASMRFLCAMLSGSDIASMKESTASIPSNTEASESTSR